MAIQANNYTSGSGVDLATGYAVVSNVIVSKIMNDTVQTNPETGEARTTPAHYAVTYMAEVYKDQAAREAGLSPLEAIGSAPGDLSFTTENMTTDVFTQCYTHLAAVLETDSTEV